MKIQVHRIKEIQEMEVMITANEKDPNLETLLTSISFLQGHLIGRQGGRQYPLLSTEVFYVESIEENVTIFTTDNSYESSYRLYEIPSLASYFLRISKSVVVNSSKIKSFRSTLNGKLEATLENGDRVEVSRAYVSDLKRILGGK
jgi:DNA-binding LytR/AlgR family response regulator